jgi:hypothetical protein
MPRYFMHLRNHIDEILDPEGVEMASLEAVKSAVLASARDVMVGDLKKGLLDLRHRIDAEKMAGAIIFTLPFKHAVNIIPE